MLEKINLERKKIIGTTSSSCAHVTFMCNTTTCMSNDIYTEGNISTGFPTTIKNLSKDLLNQ